MKRWNENEFYQLEIWKFPLIRCMGRQRLSGECGLICTAVSYTHLKPHEIPFDVRQAASGTFAKKYLIQWLKDNPDTDVVRFTTFFYHFTLVFGSDAKEKFVDWFGYGATVSVKALEEFEDVYKRQDHKLLQVVADQLCGPKRNRMVQKHQFLLVGIIQDVYKRQGYACSLSP